jgi:hypothetical protein
MVSNYSKKKEEEKMVKNLTNSEDIKDFFEYTEECMVRMKKLKMPGMDELESLLVNLPFDEIELRGIFYYKRITK